MMDKEMKDYSMKLSLALSDRDKHEIDDIKNYLRTTMSQERLCGLEMLSIERDVASDMEYGNLITEFAARKAGKIPL